MPRITAPGVLHHLLVRGIEGRNIYNCKDDYEKFLERLGNILTECSISCYAWCLMPNHFHLLVRPDEISVSTMMQRLLTGHAIYYNNKYDRRGYLFQNRFKSILCLDEAYFLQLVRYIHLNPLKAGLVNDIDQLSVYPWSGHRVLIGLTRFTWQNDSAVLEMFDGDENLARQEYIDFLNDRPDEEDYPIPKNSGSEKDKSKTPALNRPIEDDSYQHSTGAARKSRKDNHSRTVENPRKLSLPALDRKISRSIGQLNPENNKQSTRARTMFTYLAVEKYGYSKAEVARYLGQSLPAVMKNIRRAVKIFPEMIE